ncbi:MAG TPA: lytic transglycosylase domain-containing protein, partial [Polyangiaceae bacterium]
MRRKVWSLSLGTLVLLSVPLGAPAGAWAADGGAPAPAPTPTHTGTLPPAPAVTASATAAVTATAAAPPKKPPPPAPVVAKPPMAKPPTHPAGRPDPNVRHQVAGGPTADDAAGGAESPELRALGEAERELFPPAAAGLSDPWPSELPYPLARVDGAPRAYTTGLPPAPVPSSPATAEGGKDLSWLSQLTMPDLPVRWESRLVRYLEFYKDDPRGKAIAALYARRSGRYRESIGRVLRRKGLPQDLVWLAMIESAFDPVIRSPAGAIGLWQFMPETGKSYGLPQDRWVDERLDVDAATEAAADFLSDLNRRFGSWELAMASYNMG